MSAITLGHPEAHEKLTGKLFYKRTRDTGFIDAGNVREFADATARSLVTRARADDGARFVNAEQVDVNHEAYTFLLDERDPQNEILINLGRQLADVNQSAVEGATATIEDVVDGKWFAIGAYNVANVTVSGNASGALEEGVDYELNRENGRIHILDDRNLDGETLTLTFDKPAIAFQQYESQYDALFYCDIIFEEHNQFSKLWLRRASLTGYLSVTEFPSHSGEFGTHRARMTPNGPVTWLKRPEGQTLNVAPETAEGAGKSSSSSSLSSATSSASMSSSS